MRMDIFMDNVKFIEEYNAREDTTMTLGLNSFSDLVKNKNFQFHDNYMPDNMISLVLIMAKQLYL